MKKTLKLKKVLPILFGLTGILIASSCGSRIPMLDDEFTDQPPRSPAQIPQDSNPASAKQTSATSLDGTHSEDARIFAEYLEESTQDAFQKTLTLAEAMSLGIKNHRSLLSPYTGNGAYHFNNLAHEIRGSYWRTMIAQDFIPRLDLILSEARNLLIGTPYNQPERDQEQRLRVQKEILDTQKRLYAIRSDLSEAASELSTLVYAKSGVHVRVQSIPIPLPGELLISKNVKRLESYALHQRRHAPDQSDQASILSELESARLKHDASVEQFTTITDLQRVELDLARIDVHRSENLSPQEKLTIQLSNFISQLEFALAYAELSESYSNLLSSLGVSMEPENADQLSVADLSRVLATHPLLYAFECRGTIDRRPRGMRVIRRIDFLPYGSSADGPVSRAEIPPGHPVSPINSSLDGSVPLGSNALEDSILN